MLGSYAIVGAHLPMAVGAAWSAMLRGTEQIAVAFFGDGATNIGAFHEALNLAAVWRAPGAVRLREQPLHGVHADRLGHRRGQPRRRPRAAYGIPAELIDGNDVLVVRDTVAAAADRARSGGGPTIIEARTYRHFGHSRADPATYRPEEEVKSWLDRDPLDLARARLDGLGVAKEEVWPPTSGRSGSSPTPSLRRRRPRPRIRPTRSPMSGPTGEPHGGRSDRPDDHLPRGGGRGHRQGDAPRRHGGLPRRGHRRRRGGVQDDGRPVRRSSGRGASGTPRSPSRRSSVRRWVRR